MTAPTPSSQSALKASFALWMHVEDIRCAHGHHIPRNIIPLPAGAIQCPSKDTPHGGRCNAYVFIVAANAAAIAYVVGTDYRAVAEIAARDMHPLEALEYLGLAPSLSVFRPQPTVNRDRQPHHPVTPRRK